jgi:D-alanyl-D-alanine carboxypeptidase/D-alanyl-D-alanine-endopeptidase (penicillin-binding protein 4)
LKGNLIVVGSGDPTFKSEAFLNWYEALKKYKIQKITGDVIGIDSIFDDQKVGLLWSWDDLSNCYSAQVSGLQINNNCVEMKITPSPNGARAHVKKFPDTSYVAIYNNTQTAAGHSSLRFKRQEDSNNIYIDGVISKNAQELSKYVSVNNPTLYFSTLLYEGLKDNGFAVLGRPKDARDVGYILNRNNAYQVANHKSPPLKAIISDFLKHSINLYGESILNGRLEINLIFKQFSLPEDTLFIADGSGLSMLNLISPEYMTSLLYSVSRSYQYRNFFDALSTSGMDGTLKKRLTSEYLRGAVHAKTGYIRNVRTLSGYIDTFGNDRLAFAVFANNYDNKLDKAEAIINKACAIMRLYNAGKDPGPADSDLAAYRPTVL